MAEILMSPSEAAKKLGVAPTTVRYWIKTGKIKAARLPNGYWRIRAGDLKVFRKPLDFKFHK